MKTLFLSTHDISGGAARAANWLARGLIDGGEEVAMCVQQKAHDNSWAWKIKKNNLNKFFDIARPHIDGLPLAIYPDRTKTQWSLNLMRNSKLLAELNLYNPDIINMHWVGDGFVPINLIKKFKKPIVWSLYDMWPFTGGCHYDEACGRFVDSCGKCPQLRSNRKDISSYIHSQKMKHWSGIPMTIVAPSQWLAAEAKKSSLFKDMNIEVIPHGTDLNIFKPIAKNLAKDILGLDKDKRYILFGAGSGTQDLRKGFQYLEPALKHLATKNDFEDINILIFGSTKPLNPPDLGFPVTYIGRLHDDISLSVLYSASEVTVTPSIQEAFGMTASESMACGTPVLAFGSSGPLDVIDHMIDGYLAKPFEIDDLINGFEWLLDSSRSRSLAVLSRNKCELKFALKNVSNQYINLYNNIKKEYIK